jgi:hypothetical protein
LLLLEVAGGFGSNVVGDAHRRIGDRRLKSALVDLCSQSCGDAGVRVGRGCRSKILSSWWPARAAKACRTWCERSEAVSFTCSCARRRYEGNGVPCAWVEILRCCQSEARDRAGFKLLGRERARCDGGWK